MNYHPFYFIGTQSPIKNTALSVQIIYKRWGVLKSKCFKIMLSLQNRLLKFNQKSFSAALSWGQVKMAASLLEIIHKCFSFLFFTVNTSLQNKLILLHTFSGADRKTDPNRAVHAQS